jgi:hypothetical protein
MATNLQADTVSVGGNGSIGTIDVFDAATKHTIRIGGAQGPGRIGIGGNGSIGVIEVFDAVGPPTIHIGPRDIEIAGLLKIPHVLAHRSVSTNELNASVLNINLVKVRDDIVLKNADCAEDFDIANADLVEPGTVMVLGDEGSLHQSCQPYDKRVAGVISGAEGYKPGIVLDKRESQSNRQPIALLGKVYCKVDAQYAPVEVGDLLTTSSTPGHAMKASDPLKAFGAIIGKALRPFRDGQGLMPILITLQ